MSRGETLFSARGLHKSHGGRKVLESVSLELGPHDTAAVVGPSGCGKTTLLYLLCGLSAPDAGVIELGGRVVAGCSSKIAIILQDYGLLPWKNVLDNVALGLKIAGVGRAERKRAAAEKLFEMGLSGREKDYPGCLSGGEQQRVAIARAFAARPELMLMDEPFSSLDAITREKLQDALLTAWNRNRVPYVLVTHSVEEAVVLGRRILVLAGSPASIAQEFDNPGFGKPGYRESPEAFALMGEVRQSMQRFF